MVEVDLSNIPENGTFMPCPDCKGRFWINRESYARMALRKDGKAYCDKCNNELTHSIVCTDCGIMYPDYYLVQASKPPRRKIEKPDLLSFSFSLKSAKPTYTYTYTPANEPRKSATTPNIFLKRAGVAVLFVLLAIGIGVFYHMKKAEQLYAKNYMRALYTIKSGTELSLMTCAKISTEWRKNTEMGQKYAPHIDSEDETRLKMVKDTADRFMKLLNKPPKKYNNSSLKLANLYETYKKTHAMALTPPNSLTDLTISADKAKNDFLTAAQDLKNNLPAELSSELKLAQIKYKGLRDI